MKKIICIFILAISIMTYSANEEIYKAQNEALENYNNTKNVKISIEILENSGIKRIIENKPEEIPVKKYVSILNDYAFYISEIDDKYKESISIFEKIITLQPNRIVAYLNLADIYSKEYNKNKEESFNNRAKQYYQKYYELIKIEKKKTDIPFRVYEAVYSDNSLLTYFLKKAYMIENIEKPTELEEIFLKEANMEDKIYKEFSYYIKTFTNYEDNEAILWSNPIESYSAYYVDINNDGEQEINLIGYFGTINNQNSVYFKKDADGKWEVIRSFEGDKLENIKYYRYKDSFYITYKRDNSYVIIGDKSYKITVNILGKPVLTAEKRTEIAEKLIKYSEEYVSFYKMIFYDDPGKDNIIKWEGIYYDNEHIGIDIDNNGAEESVFLRKSGKYTYLNKIIKNVNGKSYNAIYRSLSSLIGLDNYNSVYGDISFGKVGSETYIVNSYINDYSDIVFNIYQLKNNIAKKVDIVYAKYKKNIEIDLYEE